MAPSSCNSQLPLSEQCCLPQVAFNIPSMKNPGLPMKMAEAHENQKGSWTGGFLMFPVLQRVRVDLWKTVWKISDQCKRVVERLSSKMFSFLMAGYKVAMTGRLEYLGLFAQRRPGGEAKTEDTGSVIMFLETEIEIIDDLGNLGLTYLVGQEALGTDLRRRSEEQDDEEDDGVEDDVDLADDDGDEYWDDGGGDDDDDDDDGGDDDCDDDDDDDEDDEDNEVVLLDWLELDPDESVTDEGPLRRNQSALTLKALNHQEERETDQSDGEDDESSWSDDDESDSEGSTESTELWESFINNSDPYNPLNFSSSTGTKTSETIQFQLPAVQTSDRGQATCKEAEEDTKCPGLGTKQRVRKVHFDDHVTVHPLVDWSSESSAARDGSCWLEMARDRERFSRRVVSMGDVLNPCLTPQHRAAVWERLHRDSF